MPGSMAKRNFVPTWLGGVKRRGGRGRKYKKKRKYPARKKRGRKGRRGKRAFIPVGGGGKVVKKSKKMRNIFNTKNKMMKFLPLVKVMKEIPPSHRIILLEHLSGETCRDIYECITKVLKGEGHTRHQQAKIAKILLPHKKSLQKLLTSKKSKSIQLNHVGGSLGVVFSSILPLLLELVRKRKWSEK